MSRERHLAALALRFCGNDRTEAHKMAQEQIKMFFDDATGHPARGPIFANWSAGMAQKWGRAAALLAPAAPPAQMGLF